MDYSPYDILIDGQSFMVALIEFYARLSSTG